MADRLPGGGDRPIIAETVRARIRMLAAQYRITHAVLAERLSDTLDESVSRSRVSQVLRGVSNVQLKEIEAWADALHTTPAFLLGFTWDPTPPARLAGATPGNVRRPRRQTPGSVVVPFRPRPPAPQKQPNGLGTILAFRP